jgi:protein DJ-1
LPSKPTADVLVIPGGLVGAQTFSTDQAVQSLIRSYRDAGKYVGAICAGTLAVVASVAGAGKTEGLESSKKARVTSHPSVKDQIVDAGWEYADDKERVVVDGKLITSRGPGTALTFVLMIVELISGKEKRTEVKEPMIVAPTL